MASIKSNISEGLVRNALDHLVLPMLSIDEYESKISDKRAIVVGFFVDEEMPARDLSNFIDRSNHPILDTEVSPAPTPEGYFMVFIEIERDEHFPENLIKMLDDVENLTNIDKWTFQAPGKEDVIDLSVKALKSCITLDQDDIIDQPDVDDEQSNDMVPEPKNDDNAEKLAEFWKFATVDSFLLEGNHLTFNHFGNTHRYKILAPVQETLAILTDDTDARRLQHILGGAYSVFATNHGLIVENGIKQRLINKID